MKNFKYLFAVIAIVVLAVTAFSRLELARADHGNNGGDNGGNTNSDMSASQGENGGSQNSPSLSVKSNGGLVINGASLVSNSGQSLVAKVFGWNLNVNITSSTTIVGLVQGNASSSTGMQAGDIIDIQGTVDASSGVITASWLRDESQQQQSIQSIQQQIQALFDQLRKLQAQLKLQTGGSNSNE